MRALSPSWTTRNKQKALEVVPKLMTPDCPAGPLHISVRRWFFTHASGTGVGVGRGTVVGGGAVGAGGAGVGGGLMTPPHAVVDAMMTNSTESRPRRGA